MSSPNDHLSTKPVDDNRGFAVSSGLTRHHRDLAVDRPSTTWSYSHLAFARPRHSIQIGDQCRVDPVSIVQRRSRTNSISELRVGSRNPAQVPILIFNLTCFVFWRISSRSAQQSSRGQSIFTEIIPVRRAINSGRPPVLSVHRQNLRSRTQSALRDATWWQLASPADAAESRVEFAIFHQRRIDKIGWLGLCCCRGLSRGGRRDGWRCFVVAGQALRGFADRSTICGLLTECAL